MSVDPLLENPPPRTFQSTLRDGFEFGFHSLLRHAPIDLASDMGSALVRWNVPRNRPHIIEGARRNLKILRPELTTTEINASIHSFLDNVGRLMAEFSVLHRLVSAGRVSADATYGPLRTRLRDEPTLAIVLHTGNWEVFAADDHALGIECTTFAQPPETWAQRVIASRVRRSLGMKLLHGDLRGLETARKELEAGGLISIFGDEAENGRSMAPLFGRPPHRKGNLAAAAWLARRSEARLIVCHGRRTGKSRFMLHSTPFFHLPAPVKHSQQQLLDDVAALNEIIEPIIRANLDQWYFLDDRID